MAMLGRLWAGRVYGTNTSNLFVELDTSRDTITGTLRLMDSVFGLTIYRVARPFDGTLRLRGEVVQAPPRVNAGPIEASAILTPEGHLRGEWRSAIGTAGTFEAYPHDIPPPNQRTTGTAQVPEQLYTSNVPLGAIRLYAKDLLELTYLIRKDFVVGRLVVIYTVRGNEVTKFWEDFQTEASALGELRHLKIMIQEPEAHGINKVVVIELNVLGHL